MSNSRTVILFILFSCLFFYPTVQADTSPKLPEAASRTYAQNYKDSALAFCISSAYAQHPEVSHDAISSASALDYWSQYDLENSTEKIPELVKTYLARQYASHQGAGTRLDLMKCIDLYNGPELDALTKQYVGKPEQTYRNENPD